MFKRNHVCAIAAMAAFSMMSFIACGDDVVNTPNCRLLHAVTMS